MRRQWPDLVVALNKHELKHWRIVNGSRYIALYRSLSGGSGLAERQG